MRPNDELLQKIGQVRSKWKAFVWMRGLAWVLGLLVAALAIGIYLATVSSLPLAVIRTSKQGTCAFGYVNPIAAPTAMSPTDAIR